MLPSLLPFYSIDYLGRQLLNEPLSTLIVCGWVGDVYAYLLDYCIFLTAHNNHAIRLCHPSHSMPLACCDTCHGVRHDAVGAHQL